MSQKKMKKKIIKKLLASTNIMIKISSRTQPLRFFMIFLMLFLVIFEKNMGLACHI